MERLHFKGVTIVQVRRLLQGSLLTMLLFVFPLNGTASAQSDIWITGYYAGWSQGWFNNGVLPAEEIDYEAVTHIIHFALFPRADGTFDSDVNSIRPSNSSPLITRAHAAGKKVLISIGGWGTEGAFRGATSPTNLPGFIENLVTFMMSRGYDGIDLDWEILEAVDFLQYTLFVQQLRARLDQITPRPLLTAAVVWQPAIFAAVADKFDQINIMTYDMSGAWPGWVSWHNAPVVSSGLRFASNGRLIPSADTMVDDFIAAGVPAKKLGIGIDFYGYVWNGGNGTPTGGITAPGQTWSSPPHIQVNVPYYSLIPTHYQPHLYRWDSLAQAPYLSIDPPGSANDKFVTYDNELSCQKKIEYARSKGIGGVIIWELGGGQLPSSYPARDRLLKAVKNAAQQSTIIPPLPALTAPATNIVGVPPNPTLTWSSSDGASWYRLQIDSDPAFPSPIVDQNWNIWTSYRPETLSLNTSYYWRLQPISPAGEAEWTPPAKFTTLAQTSLPLAWAYFSQTGSRMTITIPAQVQPLLGEQPLRNGDAIGVFFGDDETGNCAGYAAWENGKELSIEVWGDDPLTAAKEGFAEGDTLRFRVWSASAWREYPAVAALETGEPVFRNDSTSILASIVGSPLVRQVIHLVRGENMISTYLRPEEEGLELLLAPIRPRMLAIRDGVGGIFMPDSSLNSIGTWNTLHGYRLHMLAPDSLIITGTEVEPRTTPIGLDRGWNLIAYLRSSPSSVDAALAGIMNDLVIVKGNSGDVFWPGAGVNTLGTLKPGEGYQVFVGQSGTLVYPENELPPPSALTAGTSPEPRGVLRLDLSAGSNATLLIESGDLHDGDEVRVTAGNLQVGKSTASSGKVLIAVWGDNPLTAAKEGASDGEALVVTVRAKSGAGETKLILESLTDVLNDSPAGQELRYSPDAVWRARGRELPQVFVLEQNYPNPFNPSTTIRYAVPSDGRVTLEVFDVLGRRVALVVDRDQNAGFHEAAFENRILASGVYFYRVQFRTQPAGSSPTLFTATRKMVINR